MNSAGMVGIRWFSILNEFMDCLICVSLPDVEPAQEAMREGLDHFWNDDGYECYGDAIEMALREHNITYLAFYQEWDDVYDRPVEWWDWERWLDTIGLPIFNLNYR